MIGFEHGMLKADIEPQMLKRTITGLQMSFMFNEYGET